MLECLNTTDYRFVLQPLETYLAGGPFLCIHGVYRLSDQEELEARPRRECARCNWNARTLSQLEQALSRATPARTALTLVHRHLTPTRAPHPLWAHGSVAPGH